MAKKIGSTGPLLHPYQNGMTLPRRSSRQVLRSSVMRAVVIVERVFSVANIFGPPPPLLKKITQNAAAKYYGCIGGKPSRKQRSASRYKRPNVCTPDFKRWWCS